MTKGCSSSATSECLIAHLPHVDAQSRRDDLSETGHVEQEFHKEVEDDLRDTGRVGATGSIERVCAVSFRAATVWWCVVCAFECAVLVRVLRDG